MEIKISYYLNGITTTQPYKAIALADVVRAIQCQKSKRLTQSLRAIENQEQAAKFKTTHFDYVTFSGTFNTRRSSELINYSGYIVIDLDDVDPVEVKRKLLNQQYFDIALMFTSPGGCGVKVVLTATTADEHKQVFRMYQRCFSQRLGVEVDNSGSDIARACFIAYDEEVYYNPNAKWCKIDEYWQDDEQANAKKVIAYTQSATRVAVYTSQSNTGGYNGLSPFDDYNNRGDVVALLREHKWKEDKSISNGANIRFTRPGKQGGISAHLRRSDKLLYVFTSNSQFQPMRAYNPAQVFAVLECGGDYSLAYKRLLDMGYGESSKNRWNSNSTSICEAKRGEQ